jgi:hypothetical protein
MSRTLAQLRDTTTEELFAGIYDNLMKVDGLSPFLLAKAGLTDKPQIKWNRLASTPTAVVADCTTSLSSSQISGSPMTANPAAIVAQFSVCNIGNNLYSSYSSVLADEVAGAVKSVAEKIANDAIQGDGSTSFNGIDSYVTNSFAQAAGTLSLSDIDRLIDEVLTGGDKVIFGTAASVRAVTREIRAAGQGTTMMDLAGRSVEAYRGVPLIKTQWADAATLTHADLDEGFQLIFGENLDPNMNVAGVFALENLGSSKTKLEKEWRVYTQVFGVSKKSQGIAKLTGVA